MFKRSAPIAAILVLGVRFSFSQNPRTFPANNFKTFKIFEVYKNKVFINKSQLSGRKHLSKQKTEKSVLAKKHVKRLKAFCTQKSQKAKSICPAETVLQT